MASARVLYGAPGRSRQNASHPAPSSQEVTCTPRTSRYPPRPHQRSPRPLPGAAWQRCCTHYAANLMSATPKSSWGWVQALLHSVYDHPDAALGEGDRTTVRIPRDG